MRPYIKYHFIYLLAASSLLQAARAQVSKVWQPDLRNGSYKNPVINADYSDPDAIRVGNDFYMTASSFNHVPGLPLLHSTDLVNWKLIGHALKRQPPEEVYSRVQHGGGVWAPSIRYHKNEFYIYYPDPDFGIYLTKSKSITGAWSAPKLVLPGKGIIDPCPLWDDNGKVYLVHAYAGSRAGFKSIIAVREMNKAGDTITSDPVMVYDGQTLDPTIEGPKFYKRNGWYYIFAPAGGVSTGWQLVLRSKNVYGPYERKVVMNQGNSPVNGPHQGAWVNTPSGEDWFLHFQDKDAYGRLVHLQPMQWKDNWPVIGADKDSDGTGEPVLTFRLPVTKRSALITPPDSDEFNNTALGLQWQWQANPGEGWAMPTAGGFLRMFSVLQPDSLKNAWMLPNILAQKTPADEFEATVKLRFQPLHVGERFSFVFFGSDYAAVSIKKFKDGNYICLHESQFADKGNAEQETQLKLHSGQDVYLRMKVIQQGKYQLAYSEDGSNFTRIEKEFTAKPGRWVGAKLGMYCTRNNITNNAGFADIDWYRVEPLQ
jgi:beta-xylosidase